MKVALSKNSMPFESVLLPIFPIFPPKNIYSFALKIGGSGSIAQVDQQRWPCHFHIIALSFPSFPRHFLAPKSMDQDQQLSGSIAVALSFPRHCLVISFISTFCFPYFFLKILWCPQPKYLLSICSSHDLSLSIYQSPT